MTCQHFGSCGGCTLQNLSYLEQLQHKQTYLEELYRHEVEPIIPCATPWHYRNKMEFSFGREGSSGLYKLGLYKRGSSNHIVDLQTCLISPDWFMEVCQLTKQWQKQWSLLPYHYRKDSGDLRTLTLRHAMRTEEKMAILTIAGHAQISMDCIMDWRESLASDIVPILRRHHIKKGTRTWFEEIPLSDKSTIEDRLCLPHQTLTFSISPLSFFQPNPQQAEKLYAKALHLLALKPHETLIDLFCGTATLSLFAAKLAKQIIGVEISSQAVLDAQNNIRQNCADNVRIIEGDAAQILPTLPQADALLVDPPRCGLGDKALQLICSHRPKKLLYISCNPQTQAPEVQSLISAGYHLQTLQPVDQFPHTNHIEIIAFLTKIS